MFSQLKHLLHCSDCLWLLFYPINCLSYQNLGDHNHPSLALIRESLNNAPTKRPDTREILRRLEQFRVGAEDEQLHMDRLQLLEQLQMVQKRLAALQVKWCIE